MIATTDQIKKQLMPRLEKKLQKSGGTVSTDTAVLSEWLIHIGNTAPPDDGNKYIWLDTSKDE